MKQPWLTLTHLEALFLLLAVVSVVFNILQWQDRKKRNEPLSNALRALFNDIKTKENSIYFFYSTIFNPNNPHQDVATLRWEYGLFSQAVLGHLAGFKEAVVGALATLNPEDKEGSQVARASDYGLSDEEKKLRADYLARLRQQAQAADVPEEDIPGETEDTSEAQ